MQYLPHARVQYNPTTVMVRRNFRRVPTRLFSCMHVRIMLYVSCLKSFKHQLDCFTVRILHLKLETLSVLISISDVVFGVCLH